MNDDKDEFETETEVAETETPDTIVEDGDGEGEDENSEPENIHYDIISYGADLTIDGLVKRFDRGDVYRPDFQRNFVWTRPQASRLIESILLGLPIPSLFFYTKPDKRHIVIDGLQRLSTLKAFMQNRWPKFEVVNGEVIETETSFRLTGKQNKFRGETYESLSDECRRVFDDTVIHVTYITQNAPQDGHSSTFHIFDRLNSGGTPLHPQEMRAAIFGGNFQRHLQYWNERTPSWRKIFGNVHKRGTDQELILRFLGLQFEGENYRQPMRTFLNHFMEEHQNADDTVLSVFGHTFSSTIDRIHEALGDRAFRPRQGGSFSAPYFDAFMVVIAGNDALTSEQIKLAYKKLQLNKDFVELTRSATTNATTVRKRIKMVEEVLNAST